jgi:hypothetical protein
MRIPNAKQAALVALTWLALGVGARADVTLTTPAGLNPGDQFRFVFVTDARGEATSTSIGDYDNFVNAQAGGATYNGTTVTWQAIVSTSTVNAIDHIGQTTTPVYLSDGTLVTSSTTSAGLWSGTLTHSVDEDLTKSIPPVLDTTFVHTGTDAAGTATNPVGGDKNTLTEVGGYKTSNSGWVEASFKSATFGARFYGISGVLTVPSEMSAAPEPSSAVLAVFGAVALGAYGWCRQRRAQRRLSAA